MKKIDGKIILVDDQPVEKDLLEIGLNKLNIEVDLLFFDNGDDALKYLRSTRDSIFLIICDMNMPGMSGLDLKRVIDADPTLVDKAIPFIFSSSEVTKKILSEAYEYRVQGYFLKPHDTKMLTLQLEIIIRYWLVSIRPDTNLQRPEALYKDFL